MLTRLLQEDWHAMTEAANASPEHVANLERWVKRAKAQNPRLTDEQAHRLAVKLKAEFYRRLSEAGVKARQLAAEIDAIEGNDDR